MIKTILNQLASGWRTYAILGGVGILIGGFITFKVTAFYYEAEIASINATVAADEAARKDAVIEAQQKAMKLAAHRATLSNEVSNDYEKKIADLQQRYSAELDGLRDEADRNSGGVGLRVPGLPSTACGCDATASANRFSVRDKERLLKIAKQADEQTQRLIACQAWAKSQKQATK